MGANSRSAINIARYALSPGLKRERTFSAQTIGPTGARLSSDRGRRRPLSASLSIRTPPERIGNLDNSLLATVNPNVGPLPVEPLSVSHTLEKDLVIWKSGREPSTDEEIQVGTVGIGSRQFESNGI